MSEPKLTRDLPVRSSTGAVVSQTIGRTDEAESAAPPPVPGAVVVFSGERPVHAVLRPVDGEILLGRTAFAALPAPDGRVSRNHASCRWEHGLWIVKDLGSRNGTLVNGRPCAGETYAGRQAVVRVGDTIVLLVEDVAMYETAPARREDGVVVGARLRPVLEHVSRAAQDGSTLHITGPSGAGKEVAAQTFHRCGPRADGPFVAINCAAVPEGVAERLLFGARKGAFSGAHADAPGHVQEADGGTLFLDEVGELALDVQAKLLRVLDTREVIPLGASRPRRVDIRIVSATHRDLRELVANKRFREDLYYRLARPTVAIPPLADRRDEIPWLVDGVCRQRGRIAHASLVETCLLRRWPGNLRELLAEIAAATSSASAADGRVRASALAPSAGMSFDASRSTAASEGAGAREPKRLPSREVIEAALREHRGCVASTARALSVHRTQLRRWLAKHAVDPRSFDVDPK